MKPSKTVQYSMGFMNYCSHDPGAALVRKEGDNIDYIFAEEGFLSRKKKSYQFPLRSLNYCLEYFDITIDEVDTFVFDFMDTKDERVTEGAVLECSYDKDIENEKLAIF